jgi:uncharacterized protein YqiB (DUF1249 family)
VALTIQRQEKARHKRTRHKVDLAGLQALCAANYAAIVRLLPQLQNESGGRFVIDALGAREVNVRVLDRGPYTTLIDIEQVGGAASAAVAPQFQVRVYHDARMAEVIACHGHRHIKPRYDYPNAGMYQRDEKYQLNQFLGEYLSLCLATGRTVHGVSAVLN